MHTGTYNNDTTRMILWLCFLLITLHSCSDGVSGFNATRDCNEEASLKRCAPEDLLSLKPCAQGDLLSREIADCDYSGQEIPRTCSVHNYCGKVWQWVPDSDRCKPLSGLQIKCGELGTNTRCICMKSELYQGEKCGCQYWPSNQPPLCNNTSKEQECRQICSHDSVCWKNFECLKGCCLSNDKLPYNEVKSVSFCGDGSCNGDEQPHSCPIDCCYKMNSTCIGDINVCTPTCCQASQCCIDRKSLSSGAITGIAILGAVFAAIFIGLFVLVCVCILKKKRTQSSDTYITDILNNVSEPMLPNEQHTDTVPDNIVPDEPVRNENDYY